MNKKIQIIYFLIFASGVAFFLSFQTVKAQTVSQCSWNRVGELTCKNPSNCQSTPGNDCFTCGECGNNCMCLNTFGNNLLSYYNTFEGSDKSRVQYDCSEGKHHAYVYQVEPACGTSMYCDNGGQPNLQKCTYISSYGGWSECVAGSHYQINPIYSTRKVSGAGGVLSKSRAACKDAAALTQSCQFCGNGYVEGTMEACDLGDATHGNGNGSCPKTCSSSCTANNCPPPPAPTVTLTASPNPVAYNTSSTLNWNATTNATSCWLWGGAFNGWVAIPSGSGNTGNLTSATTYNIQCWNSVGAASNLSSVTVNVNPPPPGPAPTLTLSASPNPVSYNTASTLNWNTINATSCWATGAWTGWKSTVLSKLPKSESTGPLIAPQTYNLECWNSSGVSTGIKSVTVNVQGVPPTYSCSGTCPANTTLCNGDNSGLNADFKYHGVNNSGCTDAKCECKCNDSLPTWNVSACVGSSTPGVCNSDTESKSFCTAPTGNLCQTGNPSAVKYNSSTNKWEWTCGSSTDKCTATKDCSWIETNP